MKILFPNLIYDKIALLLIRNNISITKAKGMIGNGALIAARSIVKTIYLQVALPEVSNQRHLKLT